MSQTGSLCHTKIHWQMGSREGINDNSKSLSSTRICVNMFHLLYYLHAYNIPTHDRLFSTWGASLRLPQLFCYSNQLYQPHAVWRKDPIIAAPSDLRSGARVKLNYSQYICPRFGVKLLQCLYWFYGGL